MKFCQTRGMSELAVPLKLQRFPKRGCFSDSIKNKQTKNRSIYAQFKS